MSSSWGNSVRISIFGGSHTGAIGVNIEGLPAGESVDWPEVLAQMARRAPGQDKTATTRKESDEPRVLCGLLDGVTTGAPLCAVIENNNQRSKDYSQLKVLPRPGHADYTAEVKYGGHQDVRGGGHFSGRLTAPLVFAGAVARQILRRRGIMIGSHVLKVAGAELGDRPFDPVGVSPELLDRLSGEYFPVIDPAARESMRRSIEEARLSLDSVGGVVECASIKIAGDQLNEAVVKYMRRKHNLLVGERTAEEMKKQIGCVFPKDEEEAMDVKGRCLLTGLPKVVAVSSTEMMDAFEEPVERIMEAIHSVLERTPPELVADISTNGIVMTGGGSLVSGFDKLVTARTGIHTMIAEEAISCVALGTGKSLDSLNNMQDGTMNLSRRKQMS